MFGQETIRFLKDLQDHNERDWFQSQKQCYETHVKSASKAFAASLRGLLSCRYDANVEAKIYRINRDLRFSKDKAPYKTNIGIQFRHELGKDVHAPGYYVHVDSAQVFVGAGMWHPERDALAAIRNLIVDEPDDWKRVIKHAGFRRRLSLGGDSLKRAPKGVDPAHPLIEDLRRKDFIAVHEFDHELAMSGEFQREILASFRAATPLMGFLCRAVGVPF